MSARDKVRKWARPLDRLTVWRCIQKKTDSNGTHSTPRKGPMAAMVDQVEGDTKTELFDTLGKWYETAQRRVASQDGKTEDDKCKTIRYQNNQRMNA